jgi:hypothetical protein
MPAVTRNQTPPGERLRIRARLNALAVSSAVLLLGLGRHVIHTAVLAKRSG